MDMLKRCLLWINWDFQCNLCNIDLALQGIIAHVSGMPGCEPLKPLRPLAADIFRCAGTDFWRVRGIANYKLTDY